MNRSHWKWGSCYDSIFTIIYVSPTKMVTVKQTHPMFSHAKRDTATWYRCHNYTGLKLFYKRQGEFFIFFGGGGDPVAEWKILQLQWKHLKYCIVICHNFHAIFHKLKAAPMPVFSASGDDNMRIMAFSKTVPIPNHCCALIFWFPLILFYCPPPQVISCTSHFSLQRKSSNPWWNSLGLSM